MATGLHHRPAMGQTPKCSIHRNKEVVFVCCDCNELVCTTCSVSGHRNHMMEEIEDVNLRQRGKLLDFVNDTEENTLPELEKELKSIEEKMTKTERDLGKVLPGQMRKTDTDRYISQHKSSCQAYKNDLQKRYEHLVLMTKECKQILQSGTSVLVFDKVKDVECLKRGPYTLKYKPGTDNSQQKKQVLRTICRLCLGVVTRTLKKLSSLLKVIVKCTLVLLLVLLVIMAYLLIPLYLEINCTKMSTLVPTPDGSVWFLDKKSNMTQLLHNGTTKRIIQHHSNIKDLSLSLKTKSLWVILEYDIAIYEIAPPSFLQYSWFEMIANCLHVTKHGQLVISSWVLLEIYTKEGTVLHTADDVSLHAVPGQIIECPITGNLAVVRVHVMNPWMSDIAVYDRTLNVLFYYNMSGAGWNSVVSIAYDSFGNIVIGESRTQTVYMISGTGQYIKHLFDIKGELRCIAIQTPCNILWAAVQYDIDMNRKAVEIKQRLLDLPNPSNKCKQLRQNVLKTVYRTIRERKSYFIQALLYMSPW